MYADSTSKLALSLSEIWNERVPCRPRSPLLAADQLVQQFQGPIFFSIFDARPLLSFFSTPSVPLPPELLFSSHHSYIILRIVYTRLLHRTAARTMSKLTLQSTYSLGDGVDMPVLGFGVYLSPSDVCVNSVTTALKTGYRHIDSAQYYENEKE